MDKVLRPRTSRFSRENQLVTKGENFGLQATRVRKPEAITGQRPTRTEFLVETTLISRMVVAYAFLHRTEFSVGTVLGLPGIKNAV